MKLTLLNLDQKHLRLNRLMRRAGLESVRAYEDMLRTCWTFHDHAIEGMVLTELEMSRGINQEPGKDACQQLILDRVQRVHSAIGTVFELARIGEQPVDLGFMKRMHTLVAPVGDEGAGRYRKVDGPLGAYMHNSPPAKGISYRLRKVVEFVEFETQRLHPVHAAVEVHRQLMQVYPFDQLTGFAGRLLLNYMLMRDGYPPAILPAGVRADYYNALCSSDFKALAKLVVDALNVTMDKGIESLQPLHVSQGIAA